VSAEALAKLEPLERDLLLTHAAGATFEVKAGQAVGELPCGRWLAAELVRAAGVRDGRVEVPTAAAWRAHLQSSKTSEGKADEPNPWARGPSFNITAQIRMTRDDPAKAARLKAAAGVS
jgi:hypothetical protein